MTNKTINEEYIALHRLEIVLKNHCKNMTVCEPNGRVWNIESVKVPGFCGRYIWYAKGKR